MDDLTSHLWRAVEKFGDDVDLVITVTRKPPPPVAYEVFDLSFTSSLAERYNTDLNDRAEAALNTIEGVTVLYRYGGTDGDEADNGFVVESALPLERLDTAIEGLDVFSKRFLVLVQRYEPPKED